MYKHPSEFKKCDYTVHDIIILFLCDFLFLENSELAGTVTVARRSHFPSQSMQLVPALHQTSYINSSGVGNEEAPGAGAHPSSWPSQ